MSRLVSFFAMALLLGWLNPGAIAHADARQLWTVESPDHGQTYTYGTLQHRVWLAQGGDHHLALVLTYTNDPFVDSTYPRRWDYFTLNFPSIKRGEDGKTFFYRAPNGRRVPVAEVRDVFLGSEIKLLPSSRLLLEKPHGYLTATIVVQDLRMAHRDDD